jgi:hypothetical protein
MRSVPVVLVQPGVELLAAFLGVLISASISPFTQCSLDEAFRFCHWCAAYRGE